MPRLKWGSDQLRLAFIVPKASHDGVARVCLSECREFVMRGHDVVVFCLVREKGVFTDLTSHIPILYGGNLIASRILAIAAHNITSCWKRNMDSVDFVIAHNAASAVVANHACTLSGVPYAVYLHDPEYAGIPGCYGEFNSAAIRRAFLAARSVMCNSERVRSQLDPAIRSAVVYPGQTTSGRLSEGAILRRYFLMVHNLAVSPNVITMAQLAQVFPDERFVVAGARRLGHRRAIGLLSKQNVEIVENPSDDQLAHLYAGAHAVVVPGVENFGLTALEAAGVGTPSIIARTSGVAEVLSPAEGKAFDGGDGGVEALARAMKGMTPLAAREVGSRAAEAARNLTWGLHAERVAATVTV